MTADLMICDRNAKRAEQYARDYQAEYWYSVMNHYEMLSRHFEDTQGSYDMYAKLSETLRNDKDNAAAGGFVDSNLWGDPAQIIDQLRAKYETFGGLNLAIMASYSQMPYELVQSSLRLFVDEVLPEIQSWEPIPASTGAVRS